MLQPGFGTSKPEDLFGKCILSRRLIETSTPGECPRCSTGQNLAICLSIDARRFDLLSRLLSLFPKSSATYFRLISVHSNPKICRGPYRWLRNALAARTEFNRSASDRKGEMSTSPQFRLPYFLNLLRIFFPRLSIFSFSFFSSLSTHNLP